MRKTFKITLIVFTILSLFSLIVSYLSIYISPNYVLIPAYFGLAFPLIYFVNAALFVFWLIKRNKYMFISTGAIIAFGLVYFFNFFQINFTSTKEKGENMFKLMSYNVRLFTLYDWENNLKSRDKILDYVQEIEADIICYQEFYYEKHRNFMSLDTLLLVQKTPYYHVHHSKELYKKYFYGVATFSKFPIINTGEITFDFSSNCCIFSDVIFKGDTLRVYNCHLESIRFMESEYNLLDSITSQFDENRYKGLVKKLGTAYKLRALEVEQISDHIKTSTHPVVVCGDFNDTPISYTYRKMKGDLYDAFKKSGSGIGATYNGKVPFQRIDYIFYSDDFSSWNYTTGDIKHSDHYPIHCLLEID